MPVIFIAFGDIAKNTFPLLLSNHASFVPVSKRFGRQSLA
jgi:hypothetical protein